MNGKTLVIIIILALIVLWCGTQQYLLSKSYKDSAVAAIEALKKAQVKYDNLDSRHNALRILYSHLAHKKEGHRSTGFYSEMKDGTSAYIIVNYKADSDISAYQEAVIDQHITKALKEISDSEWERVAGDLK